jgi:putative ABC transport system permease protein
MWMHRMRAVIVLLGIALGAAVFTSVRLSIHASLESFSKSVDRLSGRADLSLVRSGGRIPETLVTELLQQPGIQAVSAVLRAYVRADGPADDPFLLIAFDPLLDRSFRDWDIRRSGEEGAEIDWIGLLTEPYSLLISDALAARHDWRVGRTLNLVHARQNVRFKVLGVLQSRGLAAAEGGNLAITDIASFQEFTGVFGVVDRIDLILSEPDGAQGIETLRRRLAPRLPEGVHLELPSETKATGKRMIRAYQLNLSILSFASLFVGTFLVYSLVALNAATRRHELAVLRSSGAAAPLLFFLFLGEGMLLGLLGWILAFPVSGILVRYLLQGVSQTISTLFVRVHVESLSLDAWEVLLSFAVTVCIATVAAVQPAREAMRVPPKEALSMSPHRLSRHRKTALRLALVGVPLIAAAIPLSEFPAVYGLPLAGYAAMFFLFVGFALLSPYGLEKLGTLSAPRLRRLGGIPAYLAGRYVRDAGVRTAISVGALITAVALFTALVVMIHSFRHTVQIWVEQTVSGDLFITGKMSAVNQFRDPMPRRIIEGLKRLRAPVDIVQNRRFALSHGRFLYELDALNLDIFFRYGDFVWMSGNPETARQQLLAGEGVVVSEVFANAVGVSVGDTYRAQLKTARVALPVLGIIRDYRTNGGVVFTDHHGFAERYFDPGWSGARLFFRNQPAVYDVALKDLRREVVEKCGSHLDMIDGRALRGEVLRIFDETFAITTVLLVIALIIAALGITTTLAVQVLERSRQLNTLFAVGASSGQIRTMIFWEAFLLVLAGEGAGLICGFILSYVLIYVINIQSFGWSFLYTVDWKSLGLSLPLIIFTALLAALPAIRLIFREPPAVLLRE